MMYSISDMIVFVFILTVAVRELVRSVKRDEGITPNLLLYISIGLNFILLPLEFENDLMLGSYLFIFILLGITLWLFQKKDMQEIQMQRIKDDLRALSDRKEVSILRRPTKLTAKLLKRYGPKRASMYRSVFFAFLFMALSSLYIVTHVDSFLILRFGVLALIFMGLVIGFSFHRTGYEKLVEIQNDKE